ncbi:YhgE/Pip domain-containing protein [Paenibacillus thiaminolyticus]|uniref:DUF3533 domain-containing protein n=1 Tax=Paenibacillus thiaminolyticus TaxID=49283 RepID=A0A3A3GDI6_PANTH|nr:YhgE/Pip family protein [Paenibacillus thiaminolyticus]RJG21883.1 DUF3533 domain-containing protein [Paenibacillus thiaminolyticus]
MTFWETFFRGIKNSFQGKRNIVTVLIISFVPVLYTFFFGKAFWDPYHHLDKLPVAIVNEDKGTATSNYGEDLMKQLQVGKDVQWRFVDRESADAGLRQMNYYAEFVIPENFSEAIESAQHGKPQTAVIELYTNSKNNFLSTLLAEQIERHLEATLSGQIAEHTVQTMLDRLADGASALQAGADQLSAGAAQFGESLSGPDSARSVSKGVPSSPPEAEKRMEQFASEAKRYAQATSQYRQEVSGLQNGGIAAFISQSR